MDHQAMDTLFRERGFIDFKWINPGHVAVSQWVRMKCQFGCNGYGKSASCPPNTPSVQECREFFREYREAVIFHFAVRLDDPKARFDWTREINKRLVLLEREVFLAGHRKAFLLFMDSCNFCEECASRREECMHPMESRPAPEAMAVDVFETVRRYGFPIEVLQDYSQEMNRYAILLIE